MKKVIINFLLVLAVSMTTPIYAHASPVVSDFFDSNKGWWMDESQWTNKSNNEDGTNISISQVGSRLEAVSTVVPPVGNGGDATYVSKWGFNLSESFAFTVGFNYNPVNTATGAMFVGIWPTQNSEDHYVHMYGGNISSSPQYQWEWSLPSGDGSEFSTRTGTNGTFSVSYDSALKQMIFASGSAAKTFELAAFVEPGDMVNVVMGAGTMGALFNGSEAYLTNFNVSQGTPIATPEPVSSALFLLGGAALAARKMRKKNVA